MRHKRVSSALVHVVCMMLHIGPYPAMWCHVGAMWRHVESCRNAPARSQRAPSHTLTRASEPTHVKTHIGRVWVCTFCHLLRTVSCRTVSRSTNHSTVRSISPAILNSHDLAQARRCSPPLHARTANPILVLAHWSAICKSQDLAQERRCSPPLHARTANPILLPVRMSVRQSCEIGTLRGSDKCSLQK